MLTGTEKKINSVSPFEESLRISISKLLSEANLAGIFAMTYESRQLCINHGGRDICMYVSPSFILTEFQNIFSFTLTTHKPKKEQFMFTFAQLEIVLGNENDMNKNRKAGLVQL